MHEGLNGARVHFFPKGGHRKRPWYEVTAAEGVDVGALKNDLLGPEKSKVTPVFKKDEKTGERVPDIDPITGEQRVLEKPVRPIREIRETVVGHFGFSPNQGVLDVLGQAGVEIIEVPPRDPPTSL